MSIIVVFADGSKRLAHNNDDLRERWELRHDITPADVLRESSLGYQLPVVPSECPHEQLLDLSKTYQAILSALYARKEILRRAGYRELEYRHVNAVFGIASAAAHDVKNRLKLLNAQISGNRDAHTQALWGYIHRLEEACIRNLIPLPEPPYAGYKLARRIRDLIDDEYQQGGDS